MGPESLSAVHVKIYPAELGWKRDKEVLVYGLLRAAGLPVPDVVEVLDDGLVLTRLPGRAVAASDDQIAWNRSVGALLRRVHGIGFEQFGYIGPHGIVDARDTNVDYMLHQFSRKLHAVGGTLRDALEQRLASAGALLARCATPVLCHNDIHAWNVLVDDELNVTGLIDVENAVAADPLLDLAKAHCYQPARSEATLAALVDGYGGGLPDGWREALDVYELWHLLELYEWYAGTGDENAAGVLATLSRLASST